MNESRGRVPITLLVFWLVAVLGSWIDVAPALAAVEERDLPARMVEARDAYRTLWSSRGASAADAKNRLDRLCDRIASDVISALQAGDTGAIDELINRLGAEPESTRPAFLSIYRPVLRAATDAFLDTRRPRHQRDALRAARSRLEGVFEPLLGSTAAAPPGAGLETLPPQAGAQPVRRVTIGSASGRTSTITVERLAAPTRLATTSTGRPRLLVVDFGPRLGSGVGSASADMLARALAASGRYDVVRGLGSEPSDFRVEGDMSSPQVLVTPTLATRFRPAFGCGPGRGGRFGGGGFGFGFGYGYGSSFGNGTVDYRVSIAGRVRLVESATGRVLVEKGVSGARSSFGPDPYAYGGPVLAGAGVDGVLEDAILDRRSGAVRVVLDALPISGRVVAKDPAAADHVYFTLDGQAQVRPNDRFEVHDAAGNPKALLRAQDTLPDGRVRARIHGIDERPPGPISSGDRVISRGY